MRPAHYDWMETMLKAANYDHSLVLYFFIPAHLAFHSIQL